MEQPATQARTGSSSDALLEQLRQDVALERLERAAVAEELGHADQQVVEQGLRLVGRGGEKAPIGDQVRQRR